MKQPSSQLPEIAAYLRRGKHVQKLPIPRVEDLPAPLKEAALHLPGITGNWNPVEIYTAEPQLLHKEKQKFFAAFRRGRVYQPSLQYDYAEQFPLGDAPNILAEMLESVRACNTPDRGTKLMKLMFFCKLKDDLATCDLVRGVQEKNESIIAKALQYKYPGVDPLMYEFAEEDFMQRTLQNEQENATVGKLTANEKHSLRTLIVNAQGIQTAFEWALARYGILRTPENENGYRVVIDRRATAIDVRDKSVLGPAVFVPENARVTGERLLGLIAHEIEGHARQSWNGERLLVFGGGLLKIDEETLYEGLAMRYERDFLHTQFGSASPSHTFDYYVFAVYTAENGGSFYDVFLDQLEKRFRIALHIPLHTSFSHTQVTDAALYDRILEAAWRTTYRVMRGHLDMQNPLKFGMAKDLAYFRGYLLDQQLCQAGHGHVNEVAICSIGQLRVLAEFDIQEHNVAAPFKNVTADYMRLLLDGRTPDAVTAAKRR